MFLSDGVHIRSHAQTLRAIRSWEGDAGQGVDTAVQRGYDSLKNVTNQDLDLVFAEIAAMDAQNDVVPDIRSWI